MFLWPAVAVVGFLVLTGFVIALGTLSVERYERERRATAGRALSTGRPTGVARRPLTEARAGA